LDLKLVYLEGCFTFNSCACTRRLKKSKRPAQKSKVFDERIQKKLDRKAKGLGASFLGLVSGSAQAFSGKSVL
jgi:hypothetical protein